MKNMKAQKMNEKFNFLENITKLQQQEMNKLVKIQCHWQIEAHAYFYRFFSH